MIIFSRPVHGISVPPTPWEFGPQRFIMSDGMDRKRVNWNGESYTLIEHSLVFDRFCLDLKTCSDMILALQELLVCKQVLYTSGKKEWKSMEYQGIQFTHKNPLGYRWRKERRNKRTTYWIFNVLVGLIESYFIHWLIAIKLLICFTLNGIRKWKPGFYSCSYHWLAVRL